MVSRRTHRGVPLACAAAAAAALLGATPVHAITSTWSCDQGLFEDSRCWSPVGVPAGIGDAVVNGRPNGGGNLGANVYFRASTGTRTLSSLTIDEPGGSTTAATFWQDGGTLGSGSLRIGTTRGGSYVQYGGSHRAASVTLAGQARRATYQLSGGSLQVDTQLSIGGGDSAEPSSFVHYGGSASIPTLRVGSGGRGAYRLQQTEGLSSPTLTTASLVVGSNGEASFDQGGANASVTATSSLVIGQGSPGLFTMTTGSLTSPIAVVGERSSGRLTLDGGRQAFATLQLGAQTGGVGVWQVDSGQAEVGSLLVGGTAGRGEVLHSGGTVVIGSGATIAANSRYVLSGVLAASTVLQGPTVGSIINRGSFEQTGGSFSGALVNDGIYLAEHALAGQTIVGGRLVNRATAVLLSNASYSNGLRNEAAMDVLPAGRTLTLDGAGFDNSGSFSIGGGTLQGVGLQRNSGSFSGHGRIAGAGGAFSNSGLVVQQGGLLTLSNSQGAINTGHWQLQPLQRLALEGSAVVFDNRGALAMNDGRITGSGRVVNGSAGVISGGGSIELGFTNQGTVALGAGERLLVSGSFANAGLLELGAGSASTGGATLVNTGLVAGRGRIANAIDNQPAGRVSAEGGVLVLAGAVNNTGMLVAASGGTLLVQGTVAQQGRVQLEGGTLDTAGQALVNEGVIGGFGTLRSGSIDNQGQMQFSAGAAQVHGSLHNQSGASVIVTGGGVANFHGAVIAEVGSELRVSEASAAVFFDSVTLPTGAALTGTGTFYFEGGILVGDAAGDSAGAATVDGDVVFGARSLFRAEIGGDNGGIGHDLFTAGGQLSFGGTLQLNWLNGFQPREGDGFDLFDWGSTRGRFAAIDFSAAPLAPGLRWDDSHFYIDGALSVTAVPEPGCWLLFLAGLALLRWRPASPADRATEGVRA